MFLKRMSERVVEYLPVHLEQYSDEPFTQSREDQWHSEARPYAALDFETHYKPAQMSRC